MKKYIFFMSFVLWQTSFSQLLNNDALYLGLDLNKSVFVDLNYIYKNKFSAQIGLTKFHFPFDNTPEDYYREGCFGSSGSNKVDEEMKTWYLMFGKVFILDKIINIRANLLGGFSFNQAFVPVNFQKKPPPTALINFCYENYKYNISQKNYWGIMLFPQIEMPIWRPVGLRFGAMFNLNKHKSLIGFNFGVIIGLVRNKLEKKK